MSSYDLSKIDSLLFYAECKFDEKIRELGGTPVVTEAQVSRALNEIMRIATVAQTTINVAFAALGEIMIRAGESMTAAVAAAEDDQP